MELSTVANAALQAGPGGVRAGAQRLAVPLHLLLAALQGQVVDDPGLTELMRDARAQLGRGAQVVTLVLPAAAASEAAAARIDSGGRLFTLPAGLRDALLAQLGRPAVVPAQPAVPTLAAAAAGASVSASAGASVSASVGLSTAEAAARAWAVGAQTQAAATQGLARPGAAGSAAALQDVARVLAPRATALTRDRALPTVEFDQPLADQALLDAVPQPATGTIAERLRQRLERSGLFFESHLAQWSNGTRSGDAVRAELIQALRDGLPAADPAAQRVAAQIAVLEQQGATLSGPAWAGQPLQVSVEREAPPPDGPADLPPVLRATLALDLPRLGRVEVELRLAGPAVATTVRSAGGAAVGAALPALVERLVACGLRPVAAAALPLEAAS